MLAYRNRTKGATLVTLAAVVLLAIPGSPVAAQTNATNSSSVPASDKTQPTNNAAPQTKTADANAEEIFKRTEATRNACIQGRRIISGRVLQVLPDGFVVDSGYKGLGDPPLNQQSWIVPGNAEVTRDANAIELNQPGSMCIGIVFLTDTPKRRVPKQYDYVAIQGYPAGLKTYSPIATVEKTVRRFSGGLETAVRLNLEAGEK